MPFPRADEKTKALFQSVVPDDSRVQLRPMFGHTAAFVNGNMFAGFLGTDIMVRLPEAERERLQRDEGATQFAPMGRPMKEYVALPKAWHRDTEKLRQVVRRSFEWASQLPPKAPTRRRKS
jgi:TfoX/Sxy family transcriptional regulator of competence genes